MSAWTVYVDMQIGQPEVLTSRCGMHVRATTASSRVSIIQVAVQGRGHGRRYLGCQEDPARPTGIQGQSVAAV